MTAPTQHPASTSDARKRLAEQQAPVRVPAVTLSDADREALRQAFLGDGRSGVAYALAEGRTERVADAVARIVAAHVAADRAAMLARLADPEVREKASCAIAAPQLPNGWSRRYADAALAVVADVLGGHR